MKYFNNKDMNMGLSSNFYATKERRAAQGQVVRVKREDLSRAERRNFDRINRKKD